MTLVATLTAAHLLSAPLPDLLAEVGAQVIFSSIHDEVFFGAVTKCRDGRIALHRPADRPDWEWDAIARSLLGSALDVPLTPLPVPFISVTVPA
ncbi:hypothetical protein [Streptomyces sp. NBC_00932]|uniref:hypothetical protein n=1 Tax=Streptomyces sp. NBC_00932 TaxID=2903690 RepID=UPI003865DCCA|nr:hypothetical protein OG221_27660 [Streptomyces sp. NBC_00932]